MVEAELAGALAEALRSNTAIDATTARGAWQGLLLKGFAGSCFTQMGGSDESLLVKQKAIRIAV